MSAEFPISFDEMCHKVHDWRMKLRVVDDPELCQKVMENAGITNNSPVGANDTIRLYVVSDEKGNLRYVDYGVNAECWSAVLSGAYTRQKLANSELVMPGSAPATSPIRGTRLPIFPV